MRQTELVKQSRIERLTPASWQRFQRIRLAALAEAPDAFGSTLSDAEKRTESEWRKQLETIDTFVAVHNDIDVGLVRGAPDDTDPCTALLLSMWVAPLYRGQGHGERLIQTVVEWARTAGFTRLVLDVADNNVAAVALYARLGFEPTGEAGALPAPRAHITEHRRALAL